MNKLLPFIEMNDLKILNSEQCKGIYTHKTPNGGKSIIDLVITNENLNTDDIKIDMQIYPDWMDSDHRPIKTKVHFRINKNQTDTKSKDSSFFEPTYNLEYDLDINNIDNNNKLINILKTKLSNNNNFINQLYIK